MNRRLPSRRLASAIIVTWMIAGAVLLGTVRPTLPAAYAGGAPPGFSGGFKETSCDACHFENEINAKPGELTITGVPERFAAGERYALTITLSRPGMRIGGFQLTARMAEGGAQAGTLAPAEGEEKRLAIEVSGNDPVREPAAARNGAGRTGHGQVDAAVDRAEYRRARGLPRGGERRGQRRKRPRGLRLHRDGAIGCATVKNDAALRS